MEDKDKKIVSLHLKLMPYLEKYGILLLLVIMILVMHILQPDVFLSWRNVTNVFKQISWQSMLALGVFMVIVTAGIDLSVGSIMMLSLMILAVVAKAGAPWYIVVITPLIAIKGVITTMYQGAPALATTAKIINDNIMIEPTERSIPAVTITINTPKANIDCQDICLKTLVTFLQDKKTSGCKMCITKIIITNKRRIPYFSKYGISFK